VAAEIKISEAPPSNRRQATEKDSEFVQWPRLADLRNIGKAALGDFKLLGIESVIQLAEREPTELYFELSRLTGSRQDPCVWDVFAAAIHQARTGEARNWWEFTAERKRLQAADWGF
jgi:hypothetical protein